MILSNFFNHHACLSPQLLQCLSDSSPNCLSAALLKNKVNTTCLRFFANLSVNIPINYIYPFTRKSFHSCLKLRESILKNISYISRSKFQKHLLDVFITNSCS